MLPAPSPPSYAEALGHQNAVISQQPGISVAQAASLTALADHCAVFVRKFPDPEIAGASGYYVESTEGFLIAKGSTELDPHKGRPDYCNAPYSCVFNDCFGQVLFRVSRSQDPGCCWFDCLDYCRSTSAIEDASGETIASIKTGWSIWPTRLLITAGEDVRALKVKGPCCASARSPYIVEGAGGHTLIQRVPSSSSACESYKMSFAQDVGSALKAAIIGACIFIDHQEFECLC